MDSPVGNGLLGDTPSEAVEALEHALVHHALPFLQEWWGKAEPNPAGTIPAGSIPTEAEVTALQAKVREWAASSPPDPAYARLPELLHRLAEGMRFNRRNYVNIHPSPFAPSVLADLVVALQNPNNIVEEVSKPTSQMEREAIAWAAEHLLGIDGKDGAWGNVVSGGTVANMTALLVARDYTYDKLSRPRPARVGARGIGGLKPGVVLGTAASHYSIDKALWFLGLGHENLIRVPVGYDEVMKARRFKDERFLKGIQGVWKERLAVELEKDRTKGQQELDAFYEGEHAPFGLQPLGSEILKTMYSCFEFDVPLIACVLTLGTTDTGTVERVDSDVIRALKEEDVYLHVDAASGGFMFVSDQVKPLMNCLDRVDSFTIDPHKSGLMPYPCGGVVFRDSGFREQIYHEAPYLGPLAPTLEGSRPGGPSAGLWLAIQTLGVNGYRAVADAVISFADALEKALQRGGVYQVLHQRHLNGLAVAPLPKNGETRRDVNRLVRAVRERVVNESKFLINLDRHLSAVKVFDTVPTRTNPSPSEPLDIEALRIVVTNPLVQLNDAQVLADLLAEYLQDERKQVAGVETASFSAAPRDALWRGRYSEEP